MRRFFLERTMDEAGVSGIGNVAQGVEFDDGSCAMIWLTRWTSRSFYNNIQELEAIHGHGGKTIISWVD